MIKFGMFLKLYEDDNKLNNARQMAINLWFTNYKNEHKDTDKTKADAPDSIKNAKSKQELMDAISSWRDNPKMKGNFNKVSRAFETDNQEETENQEETDNQENTEHETEQDKLEKAIDNIDSADTETLNTSEFISTYDKETAEKVAKSETEEKVNKELLKDYEKDYRLKRAENFKSIMETLSDLLKLIFPEANTDSLTKIGDNAIEKQKKDIELESKMEHMDSKVDETCKIMDSEFESKSKALENIKKAKLEKLKDCDGEFAKEILKNCEVEKQKYESLEANLTTLISHRRELYDKIDEYTSKIHLSTQQKSELSALRDQLSNIKKDIDKTLNDVQTAKKEFDDKLAIERENLDDKIKQRKDEESERIEQEFKLAIEKLKVETEQKKNSVKEKNRELQDYLKNTVSKYDRKEDMPLDVRKNLQKLESEFQNTLNVDNEDKKEDK